MNKNMNLNKKCVGVGPVSAHASKARQNKGITLIALIITIVVMLILVSVTITMAINGGLFEKAQQAGQETNEAVEEEQQLANGQVTIGDKKYSSIDEYIEGFGDIEGKDGEIFSAIYTENTPITQGEYTAVIPKGFSVGKSAGINTIEDGLVIQDEEGNQFVWIPVEVTETDTETSIASFYRSNWVADDENGGKRGTSLSTDYKEPLSSGGYTNEVAEYNDMLKSVYQNKGFYIGRFEAGIKTTESARINSTTGSSNMVVQRDCYPYTFVGWGNAMNDYISDVIFSTRVV